MCDTSKWESLPPPYKSGAGAIGEIQQKEVYHENMNSMYLYFLPVHIIIQQNNCITSQYYLNIIIEKKDKIICEFEPPNVKEFKAQELHFLTFTCRFYYIILLYIYQISIYNMNVLTYSLEYNIYFNNVVSIMIYIIFEPISLQLLMVPYLRDLDTFILLELVIFGCFLALCFTQESKYKLTLSLMFQCYKTQYTL